MINAVPPADPVVADDESDFADITAVDTVWLKTRPKRYVELRRELTAEEAYRVCDLLRSPWSRQRDEAITLIVLDGWNMAGQKGQPLAVNVEALRTLKLPVREEIEKLVEDHIGPYIDMVFPPELRKASASQEAAPADPPTADAGDGTEAGAEPLRASA
jgi:hypothetical protein